jgi:SPP1 gp7 family putative phage head morphogenesis protein
MVKKRTNSKTKKFTKYLFQLELAINTRNDMFIQNMAKLYRSFSATEIRELLKIAIDSPVSFSKSQVKNLKEHYQKSKYRHPYFSRVISDLISKGALEPRDVVKAMLIRRTVQAGEKAVVALDKRLEGVAKAYTNVLTRSLESKNIDSRINKQSVVRDASAALPGNKTPTSRWRNADVGYTQRVYAAIMRNVTEGTSIQKLSRELADESGRHYSETNRILRTETAAIETEASNRTYRKLGLKQYQIQVHEDEKLCEICEAEDGQVYDVDSQVIGENAPPWHPYCRCVAVPYLDPEIEVDLDEDLIDEAVNKYL